MNKIEYINGLKWMVFTFLARSFHRHPIISFIAPLKKKENFVTKQ
jgi:hypothetical protein